MPDFLRNINFGRVCVAGLIFIIACSVGVLIDPITIIWSLLLTPMYQMVPESVFNALTYVISFFGFLLILFPAVSFYFLRERITLLRSVYLGIAFIPALYLFQVLYNWFRVDYLDGSRIHWSFVTTETAIMIIIGSVVVASVIKLLGLDTSRRDGTRFY